jgi:hypothetical protein
VRGFAGWYRWVFGLLGLAAVAIGFWDAVIDGTASSVNYFSFFTILSNIGAFVLLLGGAWPWLRRPDFLRGAFTVYMAITGLVYALLLAKYEVQGPEWINTTEHRIMPIVVVLDWLLMPPAVRIGAKRAMLWLIFPVVYVAYTEIRGPFAHWYPYPFLDPRPHGVLPVVGYSVGVAVAFVLVSLAVAWSGDRLAGRLRTRRITL